ncbi:MAG: YfcC family protein [Deltaproteobacteria bacterium]|nr:YfcC family protein [Candidatus Zymogenaceae bacterium]
MVDLDVKLPVGRMMLGYVIIVALLVLVTVATHFVPAGLYDRVDKVNPETGMTMNVIVPDSFKYVQPNPQGVLDLLISPVKSLWYKGLIGAIIVVFIILIGGAFMAMRRTGALDAGVLRFIKKFKGREQYVIPGLMVFFSLFGAFFGILEELTPFIIIVVPMTIAMGYDSIVGLMLIFGACGVGFTAAMTNPFTVGIAQRIAEIPLFSGIGFRFLAWLVMITIAVTYTMVYAARVKKNPAKSLVANFDASVRKEFVEIEREYSDFTAAHRRVVTLIAVLVVVLFVTMLGGQLLIPKIMGDISLPLVVLIFVIMGIASGLLGGLGAWGTVKAFVKGFITFLPAGLFIMLARAVIVIADEGRIIDTILFNLSSVVQQFHVVYASWAMLVVQTIINFFIPSGSAQAMVTIPVMVPLGELVGITRQVTVLAFQMGDGFSNIFWPTNPLLIVAVSLAGITWTKWARFMLPLQLMMLLAGFLLLTIAVLIGWGP